MNHSVFDMRLRLFSDGGPLFEQLVNIPTGAARNSRAIQLMYLGLLVESGRLAANGSGSDSPSPPAQTPARSIQTVKQLPVVNESPNFAADDLLMTFGMNAR